MRLGLPQIMFLLMGLAFLIFNKPISHLSREWQKIISGRDYGEWSFRIPFMIGGAIFATIGILAMAGIIQFKGQ